MIIRYSWRALNHELRARKDLAFVKKKSSETLHQWRHHYNMKDLSMERFISVSVLYRLEGSLIIADVPQQRWISCSRNHSLCHRIFCVPLLQDLQSTMWTCFVFVRYKTPRRHRWVIRLLGNDFCSRKRIRGISSNATIFLTDQQSVAHPENGRDRCFEWATVKRTGAKTTTIPTEANELQKTVANLNFRLLISLSTKFYYWTVRLRV